MSSNQENWEKRKICINPSFTKTIVLYCDILRRIRGKQTASQYDVVDWLQAKFDDSHNRKQRQCHEAAV